MNVDRQLGRRIAWTRWLGAGLEGIAAGALLVGAALRMGSRLAAIAAICIVVCLSAFRWTRSRAARVMQRASLDLGQAVEAWVEGGGGPLRPRLGAWVLARSRVPWFTGRWVAALAGVALAFAGAQGWPRVPPRLSVAPAPPPTRTAERLSVRVRISPPAYARQAPFEGGPPRVEALRGASVEIRVTPGGVRVSEPGSPPRTLTEGQVLRSDLLDTRAMRFELDGRAPVVLELVARPDRPPEVTLEAPEADRTVASRPGSFVVRAVARDDVSVERFVLRWTLAHGRGEEMRFRNGTLAARLEGDGDASRATAMLSPAAVGMDAGDTLVVWAEAADGNAVDGPGVGRSESRLIRWETALPELTQGGHGAPLPRRGPLTERELLRRAELLARERLAPATRRTRALSLADDQRTLRESFGFFVQTETGDALALDVDDPERAQDGQVAVRRHLAEAVSAMWEAEGALSTGDVRAALRPMREAVAALDAAFGAEKKVLAAGPPPDKPVDVSKRLRGKQEGLRPRMAADVRQQRAGESEVRTLAARLLLASQAQEAPEVRALGDALWKLPTDAGLPMAELAGTLYAATDEVAGRAAVRRAADALVRWLNPDAVAVPPRDPGEAALVSRVPLR